MQARTVLVIVLAIICAASAAVGVSRVLEQANKTTTLDTTQIVVATREIPRGGTLTADALTTKEWPSSMVPANVFTEIEQVQDRLVSVPIVEGEPIMAAKIAEGDSAFKGGVAPMVPVGMRAFTISTPQVASAVGGFVMPGNKVDVLLTTTTSSKDDFAGGAVTTCLLQNVEVLAVDRFVDAPDKTQARGQDMKTVTLLVTPDQANRLSLGSSRGLLNLSLRHPDDIDEASAGPATLAQLQFSQDTLLTGRSGAVARSVTQALLSGVAGLSSASAASPVEGEAEAETPAPARPEQYIQTLRGTHRGLITVRN